MKTCLFGIILYVVVDMLFLKLMEVYFVLKKNNTNIWCVYVYMRWAIWLSLCNLNWYASTIWMEPNTISLKVYVCRTVNLDQEGYSLSSESRSCILFHWSLFTIVSLKDSYMNACEEAHIVTTMFYLYEIVCICTCKCINSML